MNNKTQTRRIMMGMEKIGLPLVAVMAMLIMAPVGAQAAAAKDNFAWYCMQCHGVKGDGKGVNATVKELPVSPMNLTNPKQMVKFKNEDIVNTITHGGPVNTLDPLMPPWGNTLTGDEIKQLMLFVRSKCTAEGCPK